jgi:integrase/recombinase XerD
MTIRVTGMAPPSIKIELWPKEDQEAWADAIREASLFEDGGLAAKWAPATKKGVVWAYGRWLQWFRDSEGLGPEVGMVERVSPATIAKFATALRARAAASSAAANLNALSRALCVMAPGNDWRWLKTMAERIRTTRTPQRQELRLQSSRDLVALGFSLMASAGPAEDIATEEQAMLFRDGLMIALLAARPLRRKNFLALAIGTTLVERDGKWWLIFPGTMVKNGCPIKMPLPDFLDSAVREYIVHVRPYLAARFENGKMHPDYRLPGDFLWLSRLGRAMSDMAFDDAVKRRTRDQFGRSLYPHLFRDAAATSVATDDPEHVNITKPILGHGSLRMSEEHYNHAQSAIALKRLQNHVLAIRNRKPRKVNHQHPQAEIEEDA